MATIRLLVTASLGLAFGCDGPGDSKSGAATPQATDAAAQAIDAQSRAAAAGNAPMAEQIGARAGLLRKADQVPDHVVDKASRERGREDASKDQ